MPSLRHLQKNQPWSRAYSEEFEASYAVNTYRQVGHDVLHVMKGLGRIAAEVEYVDHNKPGKLTDDEFGDNLADLVVCALHIANVMKIDLETYVVDLMVRTNDGAEIPPEVVE